MTVRAVYENGVFRPVEPVELEDKTQVEFEPRVLDPNAIREDALRRIREILSRRHDSGETDVAERHNEHQP